MEWCKANGWEPLLVSEKNRQGESQGTLDSHVKSGKQVSTKFSIPAFTNAVREWLVSDDQVRMCFLTMYQAVSLTFAQALAAMNNVHLRHIFFLLRPELRDCDIPRRSTMRKEIIKAWKSDFEEKKKRLRVRNCLLVF